MGKSPLSPEASRRLRLVNLAALIVVIPLTLAAFFLVPAHVSYRVSQHYRFSADSAGTLLRLAVLIPRDGPYQRIDRLDVQWPGRFRRFPHGEADVIRFQDSLSAGEQQSATVQYTVRLPSGRTRWVAPVAGTDLAATQDIESDNLAIVNEALRLSSGRSRKDAYGIYAFTTAHLSWPKERPGETRQSALEAYRNKEGVSTDFANLMAALCRAAGIPARSITGITFPEMLPFSSRTGRWAFPGERHAWTEFYTDAHWEMADASWSRLFRSRYFGRNDGRRVAFGERDRIARTFAAQRTWARRIGQEKGSMAAPLFFTTGSNRTGARVQPVVTVQKIWDGRWLNLLAAIFLVAAPVRLIEYRMRRAMRVALPTAA